MPTPINLHELNMSPAEKLAMLLKQKELRLRIATTLEEKLDVAVKYSDYDLAKSLLDQKACINPDPKTFRTPPLYAAAAKGDLAMAHID